MKVIICINTAWNLVNFRSGLIRALVRAGHEVVAVSPYDAFASSLEGLGCRFVELPMDNGGTNPLRDVLLLWRFWGLLNRESAEVFLAYTVKPNVYGSMAAHFMKIPVINNIAGLGVVFGKSGFILKIVQTLYLLSLSRSAKVFFQNKEDLQIFLKSNLVRPEIVELLPGSGVDLKHFAAVPLPSSERGVKIFRFLLIARMLWEKGVGEFVEAAALIRSNWPQAECYLLGFLDVQNPGAISRAQMDELAASGITYLGESNDVRVEIAQADCIVLPSYYREGVPRVLLEAASMARPIITTDSVGCRDAVEDGVNGYLCKVRDVKDLANKMELMLSLTTEQLSEMGIQGRAKMEREFDEQLVIDKYLAAIETIEEKNRKINCKNYCH